MSQSNVRVTTKRVTEAINARNLKGKKDHDGPKRFCWKKRDLIEILKSKWKKEKRTF